ncbi:superoxide dismutase family protein [Hyphomicrobium sp.]|uniref:superoxide dismutase family protein n=1 Tax=Hyphomicrobium sp. TaxID=82 RepID=UPI001DB05090|nr:superoxide dismutase family protein [Hyphomicrobium sp.]MBY0560679.1 superoxide dismutase family protein [Hyphomicrobium sp.]
MKIGTTAATAAAILLLAAIPKAEAIGETAVAEIKFANGSSAGTITLTEIAAGVLLKIDLKGLTPGAHGLHLHEGGKCEGDFSSAGAIYNPLGAKHGFLNEEGPMAGDLPNVVAGPDGIALAEILSPYLHLTKDTEDTLFDADGSSLVLFEKADDYQTDPEGGAEPRIACGVLKAQ